jgi:hypothetical protein
MEDILVRKEAFERWTDADKKRFVKLFADAYNTAKRTAFKISPNTFIDVDDFDFTLRDSANRILKVQHTFAAADPEVEYVGEKLQNAAFANIRARLSDLKNIYISLNLQRPLKSKQEAETLVIDIERIVRNTCNNTSPESTERMVSLYKWNFTDGVALTDLGSILSLLRRIEIYSLKLEGVIVGGGGPVVGMMTDNTRVDIAIGKKENHYASPADIVLIVHYNVPVLGSFYEPVIRENHKDSPFGGIWLYDAWRSRFVCVK